MNPSMLIVFYGICGVLIAGLLFRIWFKNRKTKLPSAGVRARVVPNEQLPVAASVPVRDRIVEEPVTVGASSAPETYVAASPSSVARSPESSSWSDRRLLEHRGILSRPHTEHMPRVLANEIPGVDDSDRTFGAGLNPAFASLLPDTPERQETARQELQAAGYYNPHALENLQAVRYPAAIDPDSFRASRDCRFGHRPDPGMGDADAADPPQSRRSHSRNQPRDAGPIGHVEHVRQPGTDRL
jgi:hypothetical protein